MMMIRMEERCIYHTYSITTHVIVDRLIAIH